MKQLISMISSTGRGLGTAVVNEPDVFLTAVAGTLSLFYRLRGVGAALSLYVVIRRIEQVAQVFANLKVQSLNK